MEITKDTLEHLASAEISRELNGNDLIENCHIPVMVVHKDFEIRNLEKYMGNPAWFRGRFMTNSIDDFHSYLSKQSDIQVFVDQSDCFAECIIDLGNYLEPGHGEHQALLTMKKTAEYSALANFNESMKSQREMAELIEEWASNLSATNDTGEDIPLAQAIAAIRNVTVSAKRDVDNSQGNFRVARTACEELSLTAQNGKLPTFFIFTCRPFDDLQEREFRMRVVETTKGDAIYFTLRAERFEWHEHQIAKEFADVLQKKFADQADVLLGVFTRR